jgi:hypothetical protein
MLTQEFRFAYKKAFGRHRHILEDNIKTDLDETEWEGVAWIQLALDRDK